MEVGWRLDGAEVTEPGCTGGDCGVINPGTGPFVALPLKAEPGIFWNLLESSGSEAVGHVTAV